MKEEHMFFPVDLMVYRQGSFGSKRPKEGNIWTHALLVLLLSDYLLCAGLRLVIFSCSKVCKQRNIRMLTGNQEKCLWIQMKRISLCFMWIGMVWRQSHAYTWFALQLTHSNQKKTHLYFKIRTLIVSPRLSVCVGRRENSSPSCIWMLAFGRERIGLKPKGSCYLSGIIFHLAKCLAQAMNYFVMPLTWNSDSLAFLAPVTIPGYFVLRFYIQFSNL